MGIRNRHPSEPRIDNKVIRKSITRFLGMLTGEPASEIPKQYAALNRNVIDFGSYYLARSGSRPYTSIRVGYRIISVDLSTEQIILDGVHPWETGNVVYFDGDSLPGGLSEGTAYYVIDISTNRIQVATSYSNAIAGTAHNITATGSGTQWAYYGEINAQCDHDDKLILMFGKKVYTCPKGISALTEVLNYGPTDPDGVSTIVKHGDDAILGSETGGIFRIVFGDEHDYMYPINVSVPDTALNDIDETETLIYGYLGIYGLAILDGTGNRSRIDSTILFETGTVQQAGSEIDYGEYYFENPIGTDLDNEHLVGNFTVPDGVRGVTHFSYYRSKNIGENSGGVTSALDGIGNRRDFLIWDYDIPVAKAFVLSMAAEVATIVSGNKFVYGDQGCTLKSTDGTTDTIASYTDEDNVIVDLSTFSGTVYCAIGGGRVMQVSQVANTVVIHNGDSVVAADRGNTLYLSDGTYRHVTKYLTANSFEVAETGDFINYAGTMSPLTGNFSRKWNDTVPDEPNDEVVGSLEDLYVFGSDLYVPRRFFKPVPNLNLVVIDSGFMVAMNRDSSEYYYSQIGDKPYTMGYYKDPRQHKKTTGIIRHVVLFPFKVIFLMRGKTGVLILTNAIDKGRTEVGEVIYELSEMSIVDTKRGVNLWQTVEFKNDNLIYAVTDDFAYRYFDGSAWSSENFAFVDGMDAVSKKYLQTLDQSTRLVALYSPSGAMKLWMGKWIESAEESVDYEIIQMCDSVEADYTRQSVDSDEADADSTVELQQLFGVA